MKAAASLTQNQKNLGVALSECVSSEAIVNMDEHTGYKNPLKHWKEYQVVNLARGEYHRQNQDG